jgi:CO/xanthine dehydrogenase Mo-binding subunit
VWDRAESVRGHGKRHPVRIHHRLASDANGRMLAATADVLVDAGCYASTSARLIDNALVHVFGAYHIGAVAATARAVFTNNPFTCAFRGFGVNQVTFAVEQQVNRLAAVLGMDPADLRRANLAHAPTVLASGSALTSHGGLPKTLSAATEAAGRNRLPFAGGHLMYGRGLACAMKNVGFGFGMDDAATAEVSVTESGALVRIGAADVGQGIETVLTQIAASALGLEPDRVRVEWQDSRRAPEAGSSSASRQTVAAGNAVLGACEAVRGSIAQQGGLARCPHRSASARYTWRFPQTEPFDRQPARHLAAFGWSTCVADVAVDTGTGEVRVLRVVDAVDAGRVMNPALFRGQVEGGIVMGQGYALQERFRLVEGMPASLGFDACAIPTAVDAVPDIETVIIEEPEAVGPFGARGIGNVALHVQPGRQR